ncbi:MAG: 2-amino-4-hydroxy-6-hydroxymethyldihydropteridine diphosphokinase [Candidatus Cryptobacteroides sp.]
MKSRELYLSIGSNLGDRKANLLKAVEMLDESLGEHQRLSSIVETKSWGFVGADFLNLAVMYVTDLDAEQILRICKEVEKKIGREEEGMKWDEQGRRVYADRLIDVDILLLGEEKIYTESLTIPHPRMWERDFVIKPLKEIISVDFVQGIDYFCSPK